MKNITKFKKYYSLLLMVGIIFTFKQIKATDYIGFVNGGGYVTPKNITIAPSTMKFEVNGVALYVYARWYVDGVWKEDDNSGILAIDPAYTHTFYTGTCDPIEIKCEIYNNSTYSSWNSTYKWFVTVTGKTYSTAPTSASANPSSICSGNSTVLSVSGGSLGTGASWEWYSGSCGGTHVGSGSSITVSPTSTTTYYVRAEGECNNTTCTSITIVVIVLSTDISSLASPTCSDSDISVTLSTTGGNSPYTYQWDDPQNTTDAIATGLSANVTYNVSITDANSCVITESYNFSEPVSTIDLGPDRNFCDGDSYPLDAGAGEYSYLWSDQSTEQTLTVTESGEYSVQVSDVYGCISQDTVNITVYPIPSPPEVSDTLIYERIASEFRLDAEISNVIWCNENSDSLNFGATFYPSINTEGEYTFYAIQLANGCKSLPTSIRCVFDQTVPTIPQSQINNNDGNFYNAGSSGASIELLAQDEVALSSVCVVYRQLTDVQFSGFQNMQPTGMADKYKYSFLSTHFDEIGIEWYAIAEDKAGNKDSTVLYWIYINNPVSNPVAIEGLKSGESQKDYQIISFPFNSNADFNSDLLAAFDTYDIYKWRLFEYKYINVNEDEFIEYPDFSIGIGKGYWLINKLPVALNLCGALELESGKPKIWKLTKGWNLVGNPYRFTVDWEDIMNANGNPGEVRAIKFYSNGKYSEEDGYINPFSGGFIYSDINIDLKLPLHKNETIQSGRRDESKGYSSPYEIESPAWYLPISVSNDLINNEINGIGMHQDASVQLDRYDDFVLPRFMEFIDMNFIHNGYTPATFSKDIVPISNEYTWEFYVETNAPGKLAELKWNPDYLSELINELILLDVNNMISIDMKGSSSYSFIAENRNNYKIIYGSSEYIEKEIIPDKSFLGNPYPNPTSDAVNIPFALPETHKNFHVELDIYSPTGVKIQSLVNDLYQPGVYKVRWNGKTENGFGVGPGIYLCKLTVVAENIKQTFYKRIVMY
ncbi:hypothetical protein ACFLU5_14610 [Bacteroidota bacterium]